MNNIDLYRYAHRGETVFVTDSRLKELVARTITQISDSEITDIGDGAFWFCKSLQRVDLPNVINLGNSAFRDCTSLTNFDCPKATSFKYSAFRGCTALKSIRLQNNITVTSSLFYDCTALTAVILIDETLYTLEHTNAFQNTPISNGTGYVYVPSALVDSYKTATNWATFADQIRAIEDYPEITGG